MRGRAIGTVRKIQPLVIGCYTLTENGLSVSGRPSWADHEAIGEFIRRSHQASGWWLADWLRYGEKRADWKERLDDALDATGYTMKTLQNAKYLGENVSPSHRREDLDFSTHFEVAPLHPKEQKEWLEKAVAEGWSRSELRRHIRASKRVKVLEGQAVLEGMYRVIYADPPWEYGSSGGSASGAFRTAAETYPTLSMDALCKLPVKAHALPDSVLFLWSTSPMLLENPGPRDVLESWGFTYKTSIVWDKVLGNFGHYVRVHHEILLIATRGSCLPDEPTPQPDSVQTIRREGEHSSKPEEFRKLITKLYTKGPYLELFARQPAEGWSTFGNDARLWSQEAAAS